MTLKSYTSEVNVKTSSYSDLISNAGSNPILIGEIIAVNLDSTRNQIYFATLVDAVNYLLPNAYVEVNTSSLIIEFKMPLALKTGEKLQAKLKNAGTNGFDIHVFYCVEE